MTATPELPVEAEAAAAVEEQPSNISEMPPNEADASKATPETASETAPLASEDVKVKFTGGADAQLEMGVAEKDAVVAIKEPNEFKAMTKSELMKYAKDPFWIGLRWTLFVLFWIAWVGMLVGAVVIVVYAPKCPPPSEKMWWQKAPIYEVYVKSFKDSDGDGVGDLKGVESKLDYLADLGVGSVWLSPVFRSPMKDNGYDIENFQDIDPTFGSLQDFKDLLNAMHDKDLKMITDFVPNHSSDKHEWFQKSVKKENPYTDFYIWRDGKNGGPPNNWKSVFGGSAWEFNAERGQFYLHQFYKEQPDFNLRNQEVMKELKNILNFWLDLGVDGFRVDSVAHFLEDEQMLDEGTVDTEDGNGYDSVDHSFTYDLQGNIEILKEFRNVLDEKTAEDTYNPRIMMTEAYLTVEDLGKFYGDIEEQIGSVSHMPIYFGLIDNFGAEKDATADNVYNALTAYTQGLPEEVKDENLNVVKTDNKALLQAWSNFNTGNHDNSRLASRFGSKLMDGMNMIVMLMQGTPITYYGDEIGMIDTPYNEQDKEKRNSYRTPMQWTAEEPSAGFSSSDSWLPVNENSKTINVENQLRDAHSHLKVFKKLTEFRHHDAVLYGETEMKVNGTVFGFTRLKKGNPGIMVIVNFGDEPAMFDGTIFKGTPEKGSLEVLATDFDDGTHGHLVHMSQLELKPKEGRVISFVPNF